MMCAWKELLQILPRWMRQPVDLWGRDTARELRLRLDQPPELVLAEGCRYLSGTVKGEDMTFCVNAASGYSPWNARTAARGYVTAPGGHRVGICADTAETGGFREISSLCIRIARDFPGIAGDLSPEGSVLILGAPGWGKTTLLRDLIRRRARQQAVAVVDERGELFPAGFDRGKRTDVLTGEGKATAIARLIRTMSPEVIAVDEITAQEDCRSLCQAAGCGVCLLATAHAASLEEFHARPLYREIARAGIFQNCVLLRKDRTCYTERMIP